tara:strand:- start:8 stop:655 length:648 start_codon:yes stop_codon:yes gene_type:complete
MTIEQEFSKLNSKMQKLKVIAILVLITPFLALNIYWKGDVPPFAIFLSVIFPAVTLIFINNAIDKRHEYVKEILSNEIFTQSIIEQGFYDQKSNDLDKEGSLSNKEYLRNRGQDEKGPSFHQNDSLFSTKKSIVIPVSNEAYQNLDSDTTEGEKLVNEADLIYSEKAKEQWQKSEREDQDIIEAGVDNLGELVKSGWFEKNAKDGAIKELYEKDG